MSYGSRINRAILLCGFLASSLLIWGQSGTVTKRDTIYVEVEREEGQISPLETGQLSVRNVITFQANRLINIRFPSATFSYQRFIGNNFGVTTSLGLPINQQFRREVGSSTFSGVDTRLGVRFYPSTYDPEVRLFFALDAMYYSNPQVREGYLREEGGTIYRAAELNFSRKRQLVALSIGFQWITSVGFSLEMNAGLLKGRRGVFIPGDEPFLTDNNFVDPLFGDNAPLPDAWGDYFDVQIGLGVGYAF